jgi:hypothetical protein
MPFIPDNRPQQNGFIPDPQPAPTPAQDGLFVQGQAVEGTSQAPTSVEPAPPSDLGKAMQYGVSQWIPSYGIRAGLTLADQAGLTASQDPASMSYEVRQMVSAPQGYEPQNFDESAVGLATSFIDPTGLGLMKVGAKLASPLLSRASTQLAKLEASSKLPVFTAPFAAPAATRIMGEAGALRPLVRAGEAAAGAGATMFTQEALNQVDKGQFDPMALATKTVAGTVMGAGLGYGAGRLENFMAGRAHNAVATMRNIFDADEGVVVRPLKLTQGITTETGADAKAVIQKNLDQARGLSNKMSVFESQIKAAKEAAKPAEEIAKLQRKLADTAQKFETHVGGDDYRRIMEVKKAISDSALDAGSKERLLENVISDRGVVLPHEVVTAATQIKDIGKINAGNFGLRDFPRLLESVEGQPRGPIYRAFFEPIASADAARVTEEAKLLTDWVKTADKVGLRPVGKMGGAAGEINRKLSERLFDAAEGKTLEVPLSAAEQSVVRWTRNFYDETLQRINAIRVYHNKPPIPKRSNYVTHLSEINSAEQMGMDLASADLKVLKDLSFRFEKRRLGGDFNKDLFSAVEAYAKGSMKTIHLTGARNQALAITEHLPQNLRKGALEFLNGPAFGQPDFIDAGVRDRIYGESALKIADWIKRKMGAAYIGGNLKILLEQPASAMAAVPVTGMKAALKAIPRALSEESDDFIKTMSRVYPYRAVTDEYFANQIRTAPGFVQSASEPVKKLWSRVMNGMDEGVFKHTWFAAYEQAKSEFRLTDAGAARYADKISTSFHAVYKDLYRPAMLRGRVKGAVLPFQTFAFNLINAYLHDTKMIGAAKGQSQSLQIAKYLGGAVAANEIYGALGLPTPFSAGNTLSSIGRVQLPGTPAAKDAVKVMNSAYKMVFDPDVDADAEMARLQDSAAGLGSNFIWAGRQMLKTYKGMRAVADGYATVGRKEYDLSGQNPLENAATMAFGPANAPAVKQQDAEETAYNRTQVLDNITRK